MAKAILSGAVAGTTLYLVAMFAWGFIQAVAQ